MDDLIKIFKALSDKTRLRMIKILQKKELCVCEIIQALSISQTRASRNLNILKQAGLVKDRRQGLWAHYYVDNDRSGICQKVLIPLIGKLLCDEKVVLEDEKKLSKAVKFGKLSCKK